MKLIVLTLLKVSQGVAVKEPQFGHGRGKDRRMSQNQNTATS